MIEISKLYDACQNAHDKHVPAERVEAGWGKQAAAARVQLALESMDILYAHDGTLVLRVDTAPPPDSPNVRPYQDRGWCRFEEFGSSLKVDKERRSVSLSNTDRRFMVPRSPEWFKELLSRLHFTNGRADKEVHEWPSIDHVVPKQNPNNR